MVNQKAGSSYLDGQRFSLTPEKLPTIGFWALALATVVCTGLVYIVLAVAYFLMAYDSKPQPAVYNLAKETTTAASVEAKPVYNPSDADGAANIEFVHNEQNYYIRDNSYSGQILIAAGMVRNAYSNPRNFIRLRGQLLDENGAVLSEKVVYAGNIISEYDLVSLPMAEIGTKLSIESGQNGLNTNIEPGSEIPFMIVFDQLPENVVEYRIDPVSSSPAQ